MSVNEPTVPGPTLLYGLLAVLQLWVLPGALLVRVARLARTRTEGVLLAFVLSWPVNHALAVALVLVGRHDRSTWLAIVAAELALATVLAARALCRPAGEGMARILEGPVARAAAALRALDRKSAATAYWAPLAAWAAAYALLLPVRYAGTVFWGYDAILAWNRWAMGWAAGELPLRTWHYPQLLPTAWSLTYVLAGSAENQLFARVAMTLGPAVLLAMLADVALRRGEPWWLAAGPLAILALHQSYGTDFLCEGYADPTVATLSLAPLYLLVAPGVRTTRTILAGALAAAAAGQCKQSGLAIALLYGPLVAALEPLSLRERLTRGAWAGALALALASPWYLYAEWRIRAGHDVSEVASIQYVHTTNDPRERLAIAAEQLGAVFRPLEAALVPHDTDDPPTGRTTLALVGLMAVVGATVPAARAPFALALFWGGIWAVFLCYDRRNFALVWAPSAIAVAAGGARLARVLPGAACAALVRRLPRRPLAAAVIGLGGALVACQALVIAQGEGDALLPSIALGPFTLSMRNPEAAAYRLAPWFLAALAVFAAHRNSRGAPAGGCVRAALAGLAHRARSARLGVVPIGVPLGLVALVVAVTAAAVSGERVYAYAIERRYAVGSYAVNRELARRLFAGELADGAIVTDYGHLGAAPYVASRARLYRHYHAEEFHAQLDRPGARYLLIDDWSLGHGPLSSRSPPSILDRIARDRATGALVLVLELDGYTLLEWVGPPGR